VEIKGEGNGTGEGKGGEGKWEEVEGPAPNSYFGLAPPQDVGKCV